MHCSFHIFIPQKLAMVVSHAHELVAMADMLDGHASELFFEITTYQYLSKRIGLS